MFQPIKTYTSVQYAEPQEELSDQFGVVYKASWSDIQHCSPLDDRSTLTYTQARRVAGMTKAGGNPFAMILRQQGVKAQYSSLLIKWKIMGLDRPTIRKWHQLTMQDRQNIIVDYAAGMPVKEIMAKYDCADSQIYRSIRILETNIPRRCDQIQITEPEKSAVLELYAQGKSTTKIGRAMNRHHSVVRRVIVAAIHRNLSSRKFVRLSDDEKARLKEMFAAGRNCAEIAKLTGHSKTTVRRIADDSPMKHHKTFTEDDRLEIRKCFDSKMSLRATARKFSSGTSSIKFWFDKFKKEVS